MPNYIYGNPVPGYPNNAYGMPNQQQYGYAMPQSTAAPPPEYMINVDGDVGARAWQMPQGLPPNTVIPLFDFDGVHVYFRSVDMYGRPNPIRKGRIVFEDDTPKLSEAAGNSMDMSGYATKEDFESLKADIRQMLQGRTGNTGRTGQNPNPNQNRGGNGNEQSVV